MSSNIQRSEKHHTESSLDKELIKDAGADSLETVQPARDIDAESTKPRIQTVAKPATTKDKDREHPIQEATPQHSTSDANASDMLETVMRVYIVRPSRFKVSTYVPSSLKMFYILNSMNLVIMNNFYAKRSMPALHPLPVRIYFSILFYIQILRCMSFTRRITQDQQDFITRFLSAYPPEDLHLPGPLLALFKTLSTSQPEDTSFGKVCPAFISNLGPEDKSSVIESTYTASWLLPQVPILLAMNYTLANLPQTQASESQWSPIRPGNANLTAPVNFMGYNYPVDKTTWPADKAWALVSPGIEFPLEANANLMTSYRDNAYTLDIPDASDTPEDIEDFLNLSDLEWFGRLNEMMSIYAKFFAGSGTLSDCSVSGVSSNQIWTEYTPQSKAPAQPTGFADQSSRIKLECKHSTTTRSMDQLFELMAFNAQTNSELPENHPYVPHAGTFGVNGKEGPFWDVKPINGPSPTDDTYLGVRAKVTKLHVQKGLL
uniref:Putative coat protein n=1 Tax=Lichen partiti-like RNA virus sp. TaxID=2726938 RepID=A0A6J4CUB4_9VIRU|nr:putative coat protein [Lichen partiti-like RNA virus sp.]